MKNILTLVMALALFGALNCFGQGSVNGVFNKSSTGTTSATVVIDQAASLGQITDLSYRIDTGVTTGTVDFRVGQKKYPITGTTSANASVLLIANTGTAIAANDYIIFFDESAATYYLRRVAASGVTSVTVSASLPLATTTSDFLYTTTQYSRPVATTTSQTTLTQGSCSIWLPSNVPVAVTIDGNTTSCAISVSGVRSQYK